MPGIAEIALGAAPIAGGALLAVAAGGLKGPDFRGMIKSDLELLEKMPSEDAELRAELKRSIEERIQDLIVTTEKSRQLRQLAASYRGNWRDVVVFICAVLFTVIWWHVDHDRTNWLVLFIVMIALSILTAYYALRGVIGALQTLRHRELRTRAEQDSSGG